jgi:hypothetical protein
VCSRRKSRTTAGQYVARLLLNLRAPAAEINRINLPQSTHTASVHASISKSAKKLMVRYGAKLSDTGLEKIITEIEEDVSTLPDSQKNKAAKSCIKRISAPDYIFTGILLQE